jgi:hypothetical protein
VSSRLGSSVLDLPETESMPPLAAVRAVLGGAGRRGVWAKERARWVEEASRGRCGRRCVRRRGEGVTTAAAAAAAA